MNDFIERISGLSPKRLALLALELKERLDAMDERAREPLAVVGVGCRFPGASSVAEFEALLDGAVDAISEIPKDRWDIDAYFNEDPDVPGMMNTRYGGFVQGIDQFDPAHFGISPREANGMDPQQRLFLEVAWEALEHAGIAPDTLAGTQTGVFLGMATIDYVSQVMQRGDASLDLYSSSGGSHAVASGRLSYILGLHGPAVSIDTACSSSLVAAHLACQSLRAGECETAIVGGVNVICAPETTLMLSRARMMAPDGRCKTFDSRADGFVRGEGCGVLVLKRLSVAQANGDRVLAVIRGSAINQDGRSSGLTAPNGPAQEAVITAALANADVRAADVDYVEAHGTGTSLGDPIELRALGATYGVGRDARTAVIASSVKTNFGHLEAAAGVAGMAKAILALHRERIPAHLHVITPTSHVDWSTLGVRLPAAGGEAWARGARPRFAAVSSFGFSGTNAHLILGEAPEASRGADTSRPADRIRLLPISARTPEAVRELAGRYAAHLRAHATLALGDVCQAASSGRSQLTGSRAVVLASGVDGATDALARLAQMTGDPVSEQLQTSTIHAGNGVANDAAEVAFVFTGQGGAHPEMGRSLFEDSSVFRDALTGLDTPFREVTGVSLLAVLYGDAVSEFSRPDVSATALVAFQIALAALWRSWGVEPSVVAGHSLGEYAAAVVAGALTAHDALRMVAARGRAVAALPAGVGAMAIIDASVASIEEIVGHRVGAPTALEIAAINAPEQVVLSGPIQDIEAAERALTERGIRVRRLGGISHAYHSAQLDPLLAEYLSVCRTAEQHTARVEWVSCLTGDVQPTGHPIDAGYWIDQMRQPVQWQRVVQTVAARGARVLIEIGPTAVLSGLTRASLEAAGVTSALSLPSLRSGIDAWSTMLETLGRGWVRGMPVNWSAVEQGERSRVPLPTYPFQRARHWLSQTGRAQHRARRAERGGLLGPRLSGPVATFVVPIDAGAPATLREHVLRGRPVFAGSAFLDVALTAAALTYGDRIVELHDVRLLAPLDVGGDERDAVLSVEEREDGASTITLSSVSAEADSHGAWLRHARARAVPTGTDTSATARISPSDLQAILSDRIDHADVYAAFLEHGVTLGESVRAVQTIWRRDGEALARLAIPAFVPAAERRAALLDGALQALGVASPQFSDAVSGGPTRMLARIGSVRVTGDVAAAVWCHATVRPGADDAAWTGELHLYDETGVQVAVFDSLLLVIASIDTAATPESLSYRLSWEPSPLGIHETLPSCDDLAAVASSRLEQLGDENGIAEYDTLIPALESAALGFARHALESLGLSGVGAELSDRALRDVLPQHWPLVRRLSRLLASGVVMPLADSSTTRTPAPVGGGEMVLLERCGPALAAVLRGSQDPLQLLFPDGSFDALDRIYRDSAFARTYNGAMRDVLQRECEQRGGAPLRILEIGAGTGGTTAFVIDVVPSGARYVFSDLSPLFLERARERFGHHDQIEYQLLDIEKDPLAQGFESGSFDVIIASNVLHATADLQRTLAHVRQLAAPAALLLLLEGTAPLYWVDLTFGMTEGWWRFSDRQLRPDHPLIGADEWVRQLTLAGFGDATRTHPRHGAGVAFDTQALIFGRAASVPDSVAPTLILADTSGVGSALAALLESRGVTHTLLPRYGETMESADKAVTTFRERHVGPTRLVYLWALDIPPGVAADVDQASMATALIDDAPVALMRAAAAADGARMQVTMVTRGAQCVGGTRDAASPEQAPLWGWARGFALEHPQSMGMCIDLDAEQTTASCARALDAELRRDTAEDQVAVRGDTRHVARLAHVPAPPDAHVEIRPDGAYLITGGTGGIGLRVAQWLADKGAGELVLLSRRGLTAGPDDPRQIALETLRQAGCAVHVVTADGSDADAMAAVLAKFGTEWRPLRGVVHAAVEMSSATIRDLAPSERASMRSGKVHTARLLHQFTSGLPLDFFVLFSSTTSLLGVHGLAHYSAANQFLDALAHYRRGQGLTALSVAWGTWDVMRVASAEEQASIARGGLRQLSSAVALDLMGRLIAAGDADAMVADIDWRILVPMYESRRLRPLIHALAEATTAPAPVISTVTAAATQFDAVRAATHEQRGPLLLQLVRHHVAAVLGYANDDGIPVERGFFELGLDSLMSVDLKRRLETAVGQSLPSTLTFNYPNVVSLVGFLDSLLFVDTRPAEASVGAPPSVSRVPDAHRELDHDALSDDDLEAELLARLEKLR